MSNTEPQDTGSTDSSHVVGLPQETKDVLESHRAVGEGGRLGDVYENVGEPLIISEKLGIEQPTEPTAAPKTSTSGTSTSSPSQTTQTTQTTQPPQPPA